MVDLTNIENLEIQVSDDRKTVWVNIDGICVFRAQGIKHLYARSTVPLMKDRSEGLTNKLLDCQGPVLGQQDNSSGKNLGKISRR